MALSKKYIKASSLLESIISLVIISTCLYIAMMVYAHAFAANPSPREYRDDHKINEQFFLLQLQADDNTLEIDDVWLNPNLRQVEIGTDAAVSGNAQKKKSFYITSP